ncbi:PREDICTED: uncharacterized protein LOC105964562 [Erythranthe guttata]|uniref:uncharacterized protein LOC105964562 n=1 Tax=Erythranthe guttata TaxID=4155 RepID=UPI00064E041E|nr:PREDICTED: uncharacterized protein LOC105964562 [Erythranthe guttata]|eukprot:XP_012844525.1 PREDICTED: uncharacterized protein LOC105964562 [Erythranthe guttata]
MAANGESNPIVAGIIGSCRYSDYLHIISIKNDSTLKEIYESILMKWNDIHPDKLVLQYLAPRERMFVTLTSNEDVVNMVTLHLVMHMSVVDIVVSRTDELDGRRRRTPSHGCGDATLRTRGHPKADAMWISQLMKQILRDEPGYKPIAILNEVQRKYGVELKYYTSWRGKEKAMHMICLDGTHIKNKYKGCLPSAVSKDPNDELYTLTYAIVDAETDRNWEWFCNKLKEILVYHNGGLLKNYTIFSGRHSGLIKAIPLVFPGSNHAYCLRHLEDNFRTKVLRSYPLHNKAYWVSILHKAAIAPTRQEFDEHISFIVQSMPRAESFIRDSDPNRWANAYFSMDRWGIMNGNQVECWNGWVKYERSLPVPSMIDTIRIKIMKMIGNRWEDSLVMADTVCPKVEKRLLINYTASRLLKYTRSSGTRYEVYEEDKSYGVD